MADIMHYDITYDTFDPEMVLKNFIRTAKDMVQRYEGNKFRLEQIENEMQDLLHYIEISPSKPVAEGYKLYRKIAELRRERRALKNENDLLWPVYSHFHATQVLGKMEQVQGETAKLKAAIDARCYSVRTDIVDEVLKKKQNTEDTTVPDLKIAE